MAAATCLGKLGSPAAVSRSAASAGHMTWSGNSQPSPEVWVARRLCDPVASCHHSRCPCSDPVSDSSHPAKGTRCHQACTAMQATAHLSTLPECCRTLPTGSCSSMTSPCKRRPRLPCLCNSLKESGSRCASSTRGTLFVTSAGKQFTHTAPLHSHFVSLACTGIP